MKFNLWEEEKKNIQFLKKPFLKQDFQKSQWAFVNTLESRISRFPSEVKELKKTDET